MIMKSDRKTLIGDLPNLDALFEDYRYCRNIIRPGHGSRTIHPPDYYFLNPGVQFMSWRDDRWVLYAKPKRAVLEIAKQNCCDSRIGSFEIVPWRHADKALVMARDAHHIATPWLAHVPLNTILTRDYLLSLPLGDYHDHH